MFRRIVFAIVVAIVLAGLIFAGTYRRSRPRLSLGNFVGSDPMTFEITLHRANSIGSLRFDDSAGRPLWHLTFYNFSGGKLKYGDVATPLPIFNQPHLAVPTQDFPDADQPPQPFPPSSSIRATLSVQYDEWMSACGGIWTFDIRTDARGMVTEVSRL